jgi:hypothetical protein
MRLLIGEWSKWLSSASNLFRHAHPAIVSASASASTSLESSGSNHFFGHPAGFAGKYAAGWPLAVVTFYR